MSQRPPGPVPAVRSLLGPGLLLLALVPLAMAAAASPYFPAVDLPLAQFVQDATPTPLGWLFQALSALGQRVPMGLFIVGVAAALWWSRRRLEGAFIAATLLPGGLNSVLKSLIDRPRPDPGLVRVTEQGSSLLEASFPSGHATQFTVVFGLLAFFAIQHLEGQARRWALGVCLAVMALVGPARVYIGAHWPSDVVGGYLFGGLWLWLLVLLYREMRPAGKLRRARRLDAAGTALPPTRYGSPPDQGG